MVERDLQEIQDFQVPLELLVKLAPLEFGANRNYRIYWFHRSFRGANRNYRNYGCDRSFRSHRKYWIYWFHWSFRSNRKYRKYWYNRFYWSFGTNWLHWKYRSFRTHRKYWHNRLHRSFRSNWSNGKYRISGPTGITGRTGASGPTGTTGSTGIRSYWINGQHWRFRSYWINGQHWRFRSYWINGQHWRFRSYWINGLHRTSWSYRKYWNLGEYPVPPEVLVAFPRCHDETLSDAERLDALGWRSAPGNDARSWLGGWWPGSSFGAVVQTDPEEWWRAGTAPILIVQPREDAMAPTAIGREAVAALGDRATYAEIPLCGHAILPEQPEAIAVNIIAFLGAHPLELADRGHLSPR